MPNEYHRALLVFTNSSSHRRALASLLLAALSDAFEVERRSALSALRHVTVVAFASYVNYTNHHIANYHVTPHYRKYGEGRQAPAGHDAHYQEREARRRQEGDAARAATSQATSQATSPPCIPIDTMQQ
jgi:hypothetical protein